MAAADLLFDFVAFLSTSPTVLKPSDGNIENKYTVTTSRDSATPHAGSLIVPDKIEQSCDLMTGINRMGRQQNSAHAAASQCPSIAQHFQVREYILDLQAALENCESLQSQGGKFEQYTSGVKAHIEASRTYPHHRHVTPWTGLRTSKKTLPDLDKTWMPYQHFDGFYNAKEATLFVPSEYRLYEFSCGDARCNCQTFAPPFVNTINGYLPTPHDADFSYHDIQNAGMNDSWLATTTVNDQFRFDWAQQYWEGN
jgi:hypothetical protein